MIIGVIAISNKKLNENSMRSAYRTSYASDLLQKVTSQKEKTIFLLIFLIFQVAVYQKHFD